MFKNLYNQASRLQSDAHAAAEVDKVGTLRGGTTGCLVGDEPVGQCHRIALLRYLGLEASKGPKLAFDMGNANEMLWKSKLEHILPGQFKYEREIPTLWMIDGVRVTGSPDVVLMDEHGKPVAGLELKAIGSNKVAAHVVLGNEPKLDNILQAAHYSHVLGVPYFLIYTSFVGGQAPYWAKKKHGTDKLEPTIIEYAIHIDTDGKISYSDEAGKVHTTLLTIPGISDFYKLVIAMAKEKNLYKRYQNMDLAGNSLPYNPCDYCPLMSACDRFEDNYDDWIEAAKQVKLETI